MVVVSSSLVIGFSQLQLNQIETTASQNVRNLSNVIEFMRAFHADLPRIFRGLLDLISQILTYLPTVEVTNPERMYDFVRWLAAMEKADGAPPGVYQAQYSAALSEGMLDSLHESQLAVAVMRFADELPDGRWTGTPTELLRALDFPSARKSGDWPQNAIALSKRLKPLQAALRRQGVDIRLGRGKERKITITRTQN
jgi:hypothetical protein